MTLHKLVPALLFVFGTACASQPAAPAASGGAAKEGEAKAAKRAVELEQARLQLSIAELEVAAAERAAGLAVDEGRRDVEEAQLALARFREHERPTELAEPRLRLDQSEHSVRENRKKSPPISMSARPRCEKPLIAWWLSGWQSGSFIGVCACSSKRTPRS